MRRIAPYTFWAAGAENSHCGPDRLAEGEALGWRSGMGRQVAGLAAVHHLYMGARPCQNAGEIPGGLLGHSAPQQDGAQLGVVHVGLGLCLGDAQLVNQHPYGPSPVFRVIAFGGEHHGKAVGLVRGKQLGPLGRQGIAAVDAGRGLVGDLFSALGAGNQGHVRASFL